MEITKARYRYDEQRPKKSLARRFLLLFAVCLVLLSSGGYTFAAMQKPLPQVAVSTNEVPASTGKVTIHWPSAGQAAIGSTDQGLLAESGHSAKAVPIASITKIVTALAVMKKVPFVLGDPGKTYTLTTEDVGYYKSYLAEGGSVVPVNAGQKITQYHILEYMLVVSGNNLADTLVRQDFGSMENYLEYANKMVKDMGLENTVLSDASGFSPKSVSTPADLIKLGTHALADPVLASIVKKTSTNLPIGGVVKNSNQLLGTPGVIGIKTGTTDEAGKCLLFAAEQVGNNDQRATIVAVVLGMPTSTALYDAARTILADAKKGFGNVEAVPAGAVVGEIQSAWGARTDLVVSDSLVVYGWKAKPVKTVAEIANINAPVQAGTTVGTLSVEDSGMTTSIVAKNSLPAPPIGWRLAHLL